MVALTLKCKCFYAEPPLSKKLKLLKGNSSRSEETLVLSKVRCQKLNDRFLRNMENGNVDAIEC